MPIRANISEVRTMLGDNAADVLQHLEMASQIVDHRLASTSLTDVMLKQIEIYLACHLYAQTNPEIVSENYGGGSFRFVTSSGKSEGFCSSKWGQLAMALDTTGTLRSMDRNRVAFHVI